LISSTITLQKRVTLTGWIKLKKNMNKVKCIQCFFIKIMISMRLKKLYWGLIHWK